MSEVCSSEADANAKVRDGGGAAGVFLLHSGNTIALRPPAVCAMSPFGDEKA